MDRTFQVLPKPSDCVGCPFYQDGMGFVPDEVIPDALVYLLMQNPGKNEVLGRRFAGYGGGERWDSYHPAPAIGKSGHFQESRMFPLAGLERSKDLSIGNVIRCQWQHSDSLPPLSDLRVREAIIHCQSRYFHPSKSIRLIIAEGEYALWGLTREAGRGSTAEESEERAEKGRSISSWRGWLLPYDPPKSSTDPPREHASIFTPRANEAPPVLAMYHTAFLFRSPWEKTAAQRDWVKVGEFLAGKWPEPLPNVQRRPPETWPTISAFDTEFIPETGHLTRYSLAYRERMVGTPHVWVVESGYNLLTLPDLPLITPTVVMHNAVADLKYLPAVVGSLNVNIEDTMIAHSLLWSDLGHTLGYLGSLYARTNRWKHLMESNPVEYSAGDALGTWDAWIALSKELQRDPQTDQLYRQFIPLLPKIVRSEARGIRTNQRRVHEVVRELGIEQREAVRTVQAWCGWPINVGSPAQVGRWLYQVEGMNPARFRPRRKGQK